MFALMQCAVSRCDWLLIHIESRHSDFDESPAALAPRPHLDPSGVFKQIARRAPIQKRVAST